MAEDIETATRLERLALATFVGLDTMAQIPGDADQLADAYHDAITAGRAWARFLVTGERLDLDDPAAWS